MARTRTALLADYSGWNVAFMLLYFLNAINITIDFGKPLVGSGAVALMGVQSGLVTWLAFSRKPGTALITTIVPASCYYFYAFATGFASNPGIWIPGIAFGLPTFHAVFSIIGSVLVGWIGKRFRSMKLPESIQGLDESPDARNGGDVRPRASGSAKPASIAAIACVAYCLAFLIAWPGDAAMQANVLVSLPVMAGTIAVLVAAFLAIPGTPRSIYNPVLTHHMIEDSDHTIGVKIGKVTVFFCTRCTAMLSGLFFSMYTFATLRVGIDPFLAFFLDIFIPAPVFIDWGLQRFGYRKATTRSRLLTGALTGLGFSLVPLASPGYAIHASIVLMSYFAVFFLIYFLSARRGYYQKEDLELVDG